MISTAEVVNVKDCTCCMHAPVAAGTALLVNVMALQLGQTHTQGWSRDPTILLVTMWDRWVGSDPPAFSWGTHTPRLDWNSPNCTCDGTALRSD